jgi:hypothetical protein
MLNKKREIIMKGVTFENTKKGLCVICNKKIETSSMLCTNCHNPCKPVYSELETKELEAKGEHVILDVKSDCCNADVKFGNITCSAICHEKFVMACEDEFGPYKKVIDQTTDISYRIPTRDLIEKELRWEDLTKYPLWND